MASRKFQKLKKRNRRAREHREDHYQRHDGAGTCPSPTLGAMVQAQVLAAVQRMTDEEEPVMLRRQPLLHEWRRPGNRFVPPAKQPVMR